MIVVIAILAAMTIVSYNGIQTRAENTKTVQAVGQWAKLIASYAATYGNYPVEAGYPCLSESGTSCGRVSGSTMCFGIGGTNSNTSYITEISKIATKVPVPSSQRIGCNGSEYSGIFTNLSTGKTATMTYFLKGDQLCDSIGGLTSFAKVQQEGLTRCSANLPTLP